MEQSPSWEADSRLAGQYGPVFMRPVVPATVPALSQVNPIRTLTLFFITSILIISSHLRVDWLLFLLSWFQCTLTSYQSMNIVKIT
jgi:hypothetical protein